jgi:hypothetical protein
MKTYWFCKIAKYAFSSLAVIALLSGAALAQQTLAMIAPPTIGPEPTPAEAFTSAPAMATVSNNRQALPEAPSQHKFWDKENRALFAMGAAGSAADFAVTYSNLQNGGRELNPVTRIFSGSTAGLATNFVGQTVGVMGLSYFFHQTGHHKLERLTPLLNFGASAFAVSYGLTHR